MVIAEFDVEPETFREFSALARRFADECIESEPGCRQFEVVHFEAAPCSVLFYEVYEDAAAFDAHCRAPHLARFKRAFAPLIVRERPLRRGLT